MPERSSTSTTVPCDSRTAATRRIPRLMKTRSSSRNTDGGMTRQTGVSVNETVLDQVPDDPAGVVPLDLLAFGVRAAVVRDRHLVHDEVSLQQHGEKLGVEVEPVALDAETDELFPAKRYVAW